MTECTHEFHLAEWDGPTAKAGERLPEYWSCPHEAHGSDGPCPFHDDDASPGAVRDAFDRVLTDGRAETNSFVGATLPDLGIDDEYLGGDTPLDLRAVTFTEKLNLEDTRFAMPVRFEGTRFEGRLELDDTEFRERVTFYGCRFEQVVEGNGARFGGEAYFLNTSFRYSLQLKSNTTFERDAFFSGADFESNLQIENATFEKQAFFRDITVEGWTSFDRTKFGDDARFADAELDGDVSFEYAECEGVLQFGGRGVNRQYDPAVLRGEFTLEHVDCHEGVYLVGCEIENDCRLVKSEFRDVVDLDESTLGESLDLSRSQLTELRLTPDRTTDSLLVECVETSVDEGMVKQPEQGELFCHFKRATVGRVEFHDGNDPNGGTSRCLRYTRFVDTTFDGFDFTGYRQALEGGVTLVGFDGPGPFGSLDLGATELERTYQRAKSGANDIGDSRAAGSFFLKEMRAKGDRHWNDGTIGGKARYVGNRLFRVTSNYAESPKRVVFNSVLTLGVYAVAFAAIGLEAPYPDSLFGGYLLLSLESFVTLVHSPAATVSPWSARMLAASEGFVGAFAIALFLFTLTRAVHR